MPTRETAKEKKMPDSLGLSAQKAVKPATKTKTPTPTTAPAETNPEPAKTAVTKSTLQLRTEKLVERAVSQGSTLEVAGYEERRMDMKGLGKRVVGLVEFAGDRIQGIKDCLYAYMTTTDFADYTIEVADADEVLVIYKESA